jgi:hypothetical protein
MGENPDDANRSSAGPQETARPLLQARQLASLRATIEKSVIPLLNDDEIAEELLSRRDRNS